MHLTFKTKLALVVGAAALALIILMAVGKGTEGRVERQLAVIQERYLPKLELGPQLENQFEHLWRGLQDAVATQDPEVLGATRQSLDQFLQQLTAAHEVVPPAEAAALRAAVQDYYTAAYDVARRQIAGEKGEAIVEAMASMQAKHNQTKQQLQRATSLDLNRLRTIHEQMLATAPEDRNARVTLNRLFHEALWHASHNTTLVEIIDRLIAHLHPQTTLEFPGRWDTILSEHNELLQAIVEHRADDAASIATEHMTQAREIRLQLYAGELGDRTRSERQQ